MQQTGGHRIRAPPVRVLLAAFCARIACIYIVLQSAAGHSPKASQATFLNDIAKKSPALRGKHDRPPDAVQFFFVPSTQICYMRMDCWLEPQAAFRNDITPPAGAAHQGSRST